MKPYVLAALLTQILPGSPFGGGSFSSGTTYNWVRQDFTAADDSLALTIGTDDTYGLAKFSATQYGFQISTQSMLAVTNNANVTIQADAELGWTSSTSDASAAMDTSLSRVSAGVLSLGDATASSIRGLMGGGAAVVAATAMPLPTGRVFHVTGTTTITSITSTNFEAGVCITLIFDEILTFTDGSNLVLAGDFVTSAADTISLCYDGTNWYETGRSVN